MEQTILSEKITYLGAEISYIVEEGYKVFIAVEQLFDLIFGSNKYFHIKKTKEKFKTAAYSEAISESKSLNFYSIVELEEIFLEYKLTDKKYSKDPVKYECYIDFVKTGAFPALWAYIANEEKFPEEVEFQGGASDEIKLPVFDSLVFEAPVKVLEKRVLSEENAEKAPEEHTKEEYKDLAAFLEDQLNKSKILLDSYSELNALNNREIEQLKLQAETAESIVSDLSKENKSIEQDLQEAQNQLQEIKEEASVDILGAVLKKQSFKTFLTVFAIASFLPFTIMALHQYIAIETTSGAQGFAVWVLCFAIAFIWDSSILFFAVNGKKTMSRIGTLFQFVFLSAKYNFIDYIFTDFFFLNGAYWQKILVIFCIVTYSPVLINQFTELAVDKNK